MYVCSNATLGSFSTGRPTGLVLDFGASQTRIVPVVDGYALNKATVTTIRAGNMFDELLARKIESSSGLPVTPWHDRSNHISYQVPTPTNNNNSINPNTSPSTSYINKSSLSGMSMPHISSVRQMFIQDVIRDCKRTSCFIPYKPIAITHNNSPEIFMDSLVVSQFELPDGTYVQPNYNLCTVPERMFFPIYNFLRKRSRQEMYSELLENPFLTPEEFYISTQPSKGTSTDTSSTKVMSTSMPKLDDHSIPLQYLILRSLSQVDTDARKELLHNILLTGGGSLTDGLVPRLSYELTEVLPPQFKVCFALFCIVIFAL